jgi:hypothetical protein
MDGQVIEPPRGRNNLLRQARIGASPGFLAGAIFVIMLAALAAMNGQTPFLPLYMFASLLMGEDVVQSESMLPLFVGTVVTVTLSTFYGMVYAVLNKPSMLGDRTNWALQTLLGALFGAALWLVNFQVFSRLFFPWLVSMPQLVLLVSHALFFGVPLGFMCAQLEAPTEREDILRGDEPASTVSPKP